MRRTLPIALILCLLLTAVLGEDAAFVADPTPLSVPKTPESDFTAVREQYAGRLAEHLRELDALAAGRTAPCVYISAQDGAAILSKDFYVPCVVDVFNCDEAYRLTAEAGVKVRGNSTVTEEERPYRIRFAEKQNMLGLHDGRAYKSWVLLKSNWNLAMDHTGFNLARAIFDGRYYASDSTFVNLYINGEWMGIYLLCEQNQPAKGRIDVHEPKEGETDILTGYVVEIDNYPSDEHPHFEMPYGCAVVTDLTGKTRRLTQKNYSVKSDIRTQGQLVFIGSYIRGCFDILLGAAVSDRPMAFNEAWWVDPAEEVYATAQEAVEAVLDVDSLVDALILQELVHNFDVGEGNFYMAIDFTEKSIYPRLTFVAPWDFNWGYAGEPDGGYYACTFQPYAANSERSNPWFIVAMKCDWFRERVRARWAELSASGVLEKALERVGRDCEALRSDLGRDAWKIDCAGDVLRFVKGRIAWLDSQWLEK